MWGELTVALLLPQWNGKASREQGKRRDWRLVIPFESKTERARCEYCCAGIQLCGTRAGTGRLAALSIAGYSPAGVRVAYGVVCERGGLQHWGMWLWPEPRQSFTALRDYPLLGESRN